MGTGRFERLERAREGEAETPARPSSVEARFSGNTGSEVDGPARSGAEAARFVEKPEGGIRVLDTESGQAFVRCASCRADNHLTARRCAQCAADLATPVQRAFNEALFVTLRAEKEAHDREVEALRERQAEARAADAEALRQRREMEAELRRRRELGLPLDDLDDVSDPIRTGGRALGRLLGTTLVRVLPNRSVRLAVLSGLGLGLVFLIAVRPAVLWVLLWLVLVLAGFARRYRR
jgi:hypothetical protein